MGHRFMNVVKILDDNDSLAISPQGKVFAKRTLKERASRVKILKVKVAGGKNWKKFQ